MPKISILMLFLELYIQCIGLEVILTNPENFNYKFAEIKNLILLSSLLSLILGTLSIEIGNQYIGELFTKLSNSGNILKLLILKYKLNYINN